MHQWSSTFKIVEDNNVPDYITKKSCFDKVQPPERIKKQNDLNKTPKPIKVIQF